MMDNIISEIEAHRLLDEFARAIGYNRVRITREGYVVLDSIDVFDSSYLEVVKPDSEPSYWWSPKCRIMYATTYAIAVMNILSLVGKKDSKLALYPARQIGFMDSKNINYGQNPYASIASQYANDEKKNGIRDKIEVDKNSSAFLTFKFECALRGIEA